MLLHKLVIFPELKNDLENIRQWCAHEGPVTGDTAPPATLGVSVNSCGCIRPSGGQGGLDGSWLSSEVTVVEANTAGSWWGEPSCCRFLVKSGRSQLSVLCTVPCQEFQGTCAVLFLSTGSHTRPH